MATDQALRDLILASNPVGYFPLDTPANLGRDISPYANHGSQSGTFSQSVAIFSDMYLVMFKGGSSPLVSIPDRAEYKGRTFTMECVIALTEDACPPSSLFWGIKLSPLPMGAVGRCCRSAIWYLPASRA